MSWQALATVTRFKARNSTEKLLMLLIANYADEDGIAFPSQARLAEDGSMDVSTVARALASLESQEVISRKRRTRQDGSRSSDEITILFGRKGQSCTLQGGDGRSRSEAGDLQGGPRAAPGHEPSKEPLEPDNKNPPNPRKRGPSRQSDLSPEAIALAKDIWAETPKVARGRSSESDLALAVHKALARGAAPARLRGALLAHYASPDVAKDDHAFAKGVHRMVERDRWREWDPGPDAAPLPAPRSAANDAHPAGGGKPELPLQMQRGWMRDWVEGGEGKWLFHRRDEPMPGQPGCRVSDGVQLMFGVEPWAPPVEAQG